MRDKIDDVYSHEYLQAQLENDEISSEEEGFMVGYMDES